MSSRSATISSLRALSVVTVTDEPLYLVFPKSAPLSLILSADAADARTNLERRAESDGEVAEGTHRDPSFSFVRRTPREPI